MHGAQVLGSSVFPTEEEDGHCAALPHARNAHRRGLREEKEEDAGAETSPAGVHEEADQAVYDVRIEKRFVRAPCHCGS